MDAIGQAQAHNSRLAVNSLIPDILYHIFVSLIYNTTIPVETSLRISHVCSHWRRSTLQWPSLWAFVDLDAAPSMVDLFLSRSGHAPLTLLWMERSLSWPTPAEFNVCPPKLYLESRANLIVPRLCSLTLRLVDHQFALLIPLFQSSHTLPLQVRHLDIMLYPSTEPTKLPPLTNYLRMDFSCLRELKLERLDLPWLELTHNKSNKLTHLKLVHPNNPPPLSQFLCFLSSCPLLCELAFFISDRAENAVEIDVTTAAETKSTAKIELPNIKRLSLESRDLSSYIYIRELLTRIQAATQLSRFSLAYDNLNINDSHSDVTTLPRFNIFEAIPSGVLLSQFIGCHFLQIHIDFELGFFRVTSAPDRFWPFFDYPLEVSGTFPPIPTSFNYFTPILDLIHTTATAEITELELSSQAWKLPWIIVDMPNLFPRLRTLGLKFRHQDDMAPVLNLLPSASLTLKKLVLTNPDIVSPIALDLVDVVSRTGVEFLELRGKFDHNIKAVLMELCADFICRAEMMQFRFAAKRGRNH